VYIYKKEFFIFFPYPSTLKALKRFFKKKDSLLLKLGKKLLKSFEVFPISIIGFSYNTF